MGYCIYADQVGSNKGNTWVHEFWVATQPSDVSDYLDTRTNGPDMLLADLSVDQDVEIEAKVAELQVQFEETYGAPYEHYMQDAIANHRLSRPAAKLGSRINLGEHLLMTIANMKAAGIERQQLTIER